MKYNFKPFDKVLVRDAEDEHWLASLYSHHREDKTNGYNYVMVDGVGYRCCIPYEGNEHLVGTTNSPSESKQPTAGNTMHGIEFKPGYVLEFKYELGNKFGIIFPTASDFAVAYIKGRWQCLDGISSEDVFRIFGRPNNNHINSGELLWQKTKKKVFTKAEIAEKLGLNENEFEIDCK